MTSDVGTKRSNMSRFHDSLDPNKIKKIIRKNGFEFLRQKGSHIMFRHEDGRTIWISECGVNRMLWRRLVKENCLIL